jgi:hypothetical protein
MDQSKQIDFQRIRAICEVSQVLVSTVRLKIDYLRIMQGDGAIPELMEPNDAAAKQVHEAASAPAGPFSLLSRGPAPNHPWRAQTVHRLQK